MQFGILGPLDVRSPAGETIAVGGPRPRALLVILLLNAGRVVGVEQLIDGQYGDAPPGGAANALQAQVSRLRRDLGAELIEFHGTGYRLAIDPDDVDAHRFERLAREGRRLVSAGRPRRRGGAAAGGARPVAGARPGRSAVSGRPRWPGWRSSGWRPTEDLVEAELALPEGCSVAELQRLVAAHPLRERLSGQLMRALQATGRQAEALGGVRGGPAAARRGARRRPLARARRGPPGRPARRAAGAATAARRRSSPASWAASGSSSGSTRCVTARLITITGPGGTGKTRLAIEAAGRTRREVCFVDLSPLDGGDQVPQAVLGALGLREIGVAVVSVTARPRATPGVGARRAGAAAHPRQLRARDRRRGHAGPRPAERVSRS